MKQHMVVVVLPDAWASSPHERGFVTDCHRDGITRLNITTETHDDGQTELTVATRFHRPGKKPFLVTYGFDGTAKVYLARTTFDIDRLQCECINDDTGLIDAIGLSQLRLISIAAGT